MIRRPPRSTLSSSSAASDVYKRQALEAWPLASRSTPGEHSALWWTLARLASTYRRLQKHPLRRLVPRVGENRLLPSRLRGPLPPVERKQNTYAPVSYRHRDWASASLCHRTVSERSRRSMEIRVRAVYY